MTTGNDKDNEPSTSSNCNNTERKEINNLTSPSPPPSRSGSATKDGQHPGLQT